jgi:hypothetical protein
VASASRKGVGATRARRGGQAPPAVRGARLFGFQERRHPMSIKSKVFAVAAALTLVGGAGVAGVLTAAAASAATPSCGSQCVDIFSHQFGTHRSPDYVVDVLAQVEKVGQPVILFRSADYDPAEDWTATFQGTVADFYAAGLVSSAVALHYGCVPTVNFPDCYGQTKLSVNDPAFEIEYAPFGVDSGLCMGVASTAVNGEGVSLQPCGVSGKTVWIVDIFDSPNTTFSGGYVPLINGSDRNFSRPFVLTYPDDRYPTDEPRPRIAVTSITGSAQTSTPYFIPGPELNTVDDNQLWGADFGELR